MEWDKPFLLTNQANGRMVIGALSLPHGTFKVIEPYRYPESSIKEMQIHVARGNATVTNDIPQELLLEIEELEARNLETSGTGHEYTVYDPNSTLKRERAIIVDENLSTSKAIEVTEIGINDRSSTIELGSDKINHTEAQALLGLHWKTFENEVAYVQSLRKLETILQVAKSQKTANKKIEILEKRIKDIKG